MSVLDNVKAAMSKGITAPTTIGKVVNEPTQSTIDFSDADQGQPALSIRPNHRFSFNTNPTRWQQASFTQYDTSGTIKFNPQSGDYCDFRYEERIKEDPDGYTANLTKSTQDLAGKIYSAKQQSLQNHNLMETYGHLFQGDGWQLSDTQFGLVATNPNTGFSGIITEEMCQQLQEQQQAVA